MSSVKESYSLLVKLINFEKHANERTFKKIYGTKLGHYINTLFESSGRNIRTLIKNLEIEQLLKLEEYLQRNSV